MNPKPADRTKFAVGCVLALGCLIAAVFFVARGEIGNAFVAFLLTVCGVSFTVDAWKKKDVPPSIGWLRWYHVLAVVIVVGLSVVAIYRLAGREREEQTTEVGPK